MLYLTKIYKNNNEQITYINMLILYLRVNFNRSLLMIASFCMSCYQPSSSIWIEDAAIGCLQVG